MKNTKVFTVYLLSQIFLVACSSDSSNEIITDNKNIVEDIHAHGDAQESTQQAQVYKSNGPDFKPSKGVESNMKVRVKRKMISSKGKPIPAKKLLNTTRAAPKTNLSTNPVISPLNDTSWFKRNDIERQATNAMLSMSGLLILLFVCVFWSGMLKQKNPYMYPALDGSWQSAQQKDQLFSFSIKELIQSKLRSLHLPKVRRKRKRKAKGPTYLELKQKDMEMSSTSEEDFYAVT